MRIYMTLIFLFCIVFILFPAFILRNYKKNLSLKLAKKEHPFIIFYGVSFFITDIFLKNTSLFDRTKSSASVLYPLENDIHMAYIIIAKRISSALATCLVCFILGLFYGIDFFVSENQAVTSLLRPADGSDVTSYTLNVRSANESEIIDIDVPKKEFSSSQILQLFDSYKDDLLSLILDENPDASHISEPLYFPDFIGEEEISVYVCPEDLSLIDSSGSLIYDNIPSDGISTFVNIELELNNTRASFAINLTLFPKTETDSEKLKNEIEKYISDANSPDSDSVSLPQEINNKKINFFINEEDMSSLFLLGGFSMVIIIFLLSKNDINKKLSKREEQLIHDFSDIISKILLLSNAGLTIPNALSKIVDDYKAKSDYYSYAYEELSIAVNNLKNGKSHSKVYSDFGKRCGLMPYVKLGTLLQQIVNNGSNDTSINLKSEVTTAFNNYRTDILMRSKRAETKLIFPMILILIVIMALIIIPSFMNF